MKEEKSIEIKVEIPVERIVQRIFVIRGIKVMLDKDLAELYNVSTKVLNQAVKRNKVRFPIDFMFRLSDDEIDQLNRLQFVTGSQKHRDPRFKPYAFTEHGVAMLSSVLKSREAVEMNVAIIRAFIKLREILATNKDLAVRMAELERHQKSHSQHLVNIYATLKKLTTEPVKEEGKMGFNVNKLYFKVEFEYFCTNST